MSAVARSLLAFTDDWRNPVGVAALAVVLFVAVLYRDRTRFIVLSLGRNKVRTALTGMATFVLVLVVILILSVLNYLDRQTEAKSRDLKAIVTEKYQIPSQLPQAYAASLSEGAASRPGDYRVDPDRDAMTWSFFIGTLDPAKQTRENMAFFFAMEPSKLLSADASGAYHTMMEDIDAIPDADKARLLAQCREMDRDPYKVLIGPGRLAAMNKRVGERIKVSGMATTKGIDLEFEIIGELPADRYDQNAVMNFRYLDQAVQEYNRGKPKDQWHEMTEKLLSFVWLRLPDRPTFERVAEQVASSPMYASPAVKCETFSSGISSFLDGFKDLLFGMRWVLTPAILATMALVISNAISIGVRERRGEMAVLKVLGFSPDAILVLVLGEALVIGCGAGMSSALGAKFLVNDLMGGIPVPMGFLSKFLVADAAHWWGLGLGGLTAVVGSWLPAWSARSVKVSEVFAKVA